MRNFESIRELRIGTNTTYNLVASIPLEFQRGRVVSVPEKS